MTMFAEPVLASAAEERMERMEGCRRGAEMENCRPRDYHHYPQHHDTPDHLREKNYHYSDNDDREVGGGKIGIKKYFVSLPDVTSRGSLRNTKKIKELTDREIKRFRITYPQ